MTINFGNFIMNTTLSLDEPVISWTFAYRGSAEEANKHLSPFTAIESAWDEYGDVPYPQIAEAQGTAIDDFICEHGNIRITATAGLQVYNVTAERQTFDGFTRRIASYPRPCSSMQHPS